MKHILTVLFSCLALLADAQSSGAPRVMPIDNGKLVSDLDGNKKAITNLGSISVGSGTITNGAVNPNDIVNYRVLTNKLNDTVIGLNLTNKLDRSEFYATNSNVYGVLGTKASTNDLNSAITNETNQRVSGDVAGSNNVLYATNSLWGATTNFVKYAITGKVDKVEFYLTNDVLTVSLTTKASTNNVPKWDESWSWGNHALAGYVLNSWMTNWLSTNVFGMMISASGGLTAITNNGIVTIDGSSKASTNDLNTAITNESNLRVSGDISSTNYVNNATNNLWISTTNLVNDSITNEASQRVSGDVAGTNYVNTFTNRILTALQPIDLAPYYPRSNPSNYISNATSLFSTNGNTFVTVEGTNVDVWAIVDAWNITFSADFSSRIPPSLFPLHTNYVFTSYPNILIDGAWTIMYFTNNVWSISCRLTPFNYDNWNSTTNSYILDSSNGGNGHAYVTSCRTPIIVSHLASMNDLVSFIADATNTLWMATTNFINTSITNEVSKRAFGDIASTNYVNTFTNKILNAWQNSSYVTNTFVWDSDGTNITITGYKGQGGDVVFPTIINGMPVKSVGALVLGAYANIVDSVRGDSIEEIKASAFSYSSITNATFPSLKNLGISAFDSCSLLNSAYLGSVTFIDQGAFGSISSAYLNIYYSGNEPSVNPGGDFIFFNTTATVTNIVVNPIAVWGTTFGGMPVVRLDLYGRLLGNANTASALSEGTASNKLENAITNITISGEASLTQNNSIVSIIISNQVTETSINNAGGVTTNNVIYTNTVAKANSALQSGATNDLWIATTNLVNVSITNEASQRASGDVSSTNYVNSSTNNLWISTTNLVNDSITNEASQRVSGDVAGTNYVNTFTNRILTALQPIDLAPYYPRSNPSNYISNATSLFSTNGNTFVTVEGTNVDVWAIVDAWNITFSADFSSRIPPSLFPLHTNYVFTSYPNILIDGAWTIMYFTNNVWSISCRLTPFNYDNWNSTTNSYILDSSNGGNGHAYVTSCRTPIIVSHLASMNDLVSFIADATNTLWMATTNFINTSITNEVSKRAFGDIASTNYVNTFTNKILNAWQNSSYVTNTFVWDSDGTNITITGYKGQGGDVVFPTIINGMPVKSVGALVLGAYANIVDSVRGDSIEEIKASAFSYSSITNATFPSLKNLGISAFDSCSLLNSAYLGSVTFIDQGAFGSISSAYLNIYYSGNEPSVNPGGDFIFFNTTATVTNIVVNPIAVWGTTFGGMPVVRLDLYGRLLGNANTASALSEGTASNKLENAITNITISGEASLTQNNSIVSIIISNQVTETSINNAGGVTTNNVIYTNTVAKANSALQSGATNDLWIATTNLVNVSITNEASQRASGDVSSTNYVNSSTNNLWISTTNLVNDSITNEANLRINGDNSGTNYVNNATNTLWITTTNLINNIITNESTQRISGDVASTNYVNSVLPLKVDISNGIATNLTVRDSIKAERFDYVTGTTVITGTTYTKKVYFLDSDGDTVILDVSGGVLTSDRISQ